MDNLRKRHSGTETEINTNSTAKLKVPDKEPIESTKTHPTVYIVFLSLLLDLLAFTMILPLLPSLLEHYRIHDQFGLYNVLSDKIKYFQDFAGVPARFNSVLFGGFLGSMFSFLQFISSPILGGLSDVYGRKPVLLLCMVI